MSKIIILFLLIAGVSFAGDLKPDDILGKWVMHEKNSVIEIYKEGENYFGKIVKVLKPKEGKDPKDVIGVIVLDNFKYENGIYTDGEVYAVEKDKRIGAEMELVSINELRIEVSIFLFSKEVRWERFSEEL